MSDSTTFHATAGYLDPRCVTLLREAAEWRLVSLLLAAPRGDWRSQVATLAAEVSDSESVLQDASRLAQVESDEGLYDSTFGPGGPAPPREVSYRPASLSSQYLAELAGSYEAFGYAPPYDEPVDHAAIEADFVAYLRFKEAFAVCGNDEDRAATAREAADRLVGEHLAWVAAPLSERLTASGARYLALAAESLARRVGPPPSPIIGGLPVLAEDCTNEAGWPCGGEESSSGAEQDVW